MNEHPEAPSPKRQRASRAGQAKRFECAHPGCDKRYSRAEHLHRHELNHNPKEVYRCEVAGCGHSFVRPDLFIRHKNRHNETASSRAASVTPGTPTTAESKIGFEAPMQEPVSASEYGVSRQDSQESIEDARLAAATSLSSLTTWAAANRPPLPTPDPTLMSTETPSVAGLTGILSQAAPSPLAAPSMNTWNSTVDTAAQASDNFAAWLFESPGSQYDDFNIANMPFLDFGLEYSPKDVWNLEDYASTSEPPGSVANHATPSSLRDNPAAGTTTRGVSEERRADVLRILSHFLTKQRNRLYAASDQTRLLYNPDAQNFPNLSVGVLDRFVANYWANVDQQMSVVHQPTFSPNSCNVLLLVTIIMLGAADMVKQKPKGLLEDHQEFSEVIATQLRWEIFTDPEAQPPVQLWAAQALLLLEYYEKQWSSRKLHERAHIHHASTLTLLRRGSPLIGRSDSESPTSGMPTRCASPTGDELPGKPTGSSLDSWWVHWVRNESFNRVVFTAFQIDTLHALMYGHGADMAPYEIRLPLPCDDSLWRADSAEEVHRLDANLKMYGIRPINFLDGLKRCLHAHDVQTHAPARMLLMAGLLSVGWHMSRREKHLQFLETVPSVREQGRWRSMLLQAFGHWRQSFDDAVGPRKSRSSAAKTTDANAPTVLFHLAHLTMHADIIDIQIFSGTKRLLGRKVSDKDFLNVFQRMKAWQPTPIARHAVLHSFKLLAAVMMNRPGKNGTNDASNMQPFISYSSRNDPMMYRPWGVYLASLVIWAYQRASSLHLSGPYTQQHLIEGQDERELCCRYLTAFSNIDDPARVLAMLSVSGCAAILSVVSQDLANGEPELFEEAAKRLQSCRETLLTGTSGR
ncbi:hypothetical protein CB0940_08554 [Cercospora beticola]|uniref:C2H2-type domain-containing protein n=1 Tax=Cercospora beticola TaxID=122368 RepID=A0A2G5HPI1_CERBT|nr:hypothetical protein CB0940_08554 [Cercospora beticola]PIA94456.1 hypothetical protein CB0940_08554 [Cercospora beticola]WPB05131.1 hypothetical protein RHO25_009781 [Cercospora beticola]CAK1364917.1 unnamed protein product [Cercospora beticola]